MNITFEQVEKAVPDNAKEVWKRICEIGGWGNVLPEHTGGLDISGLDEPKQAEILALVETAPADTVESLAKKSREELEILAKAKGLDGNKYTNKNELAQAILNTEVK
jgi:hypothetical protein